MKIKYSQWLIAIVPCVILGVSVLYFRQARFIPEKVNTEAASDIALSTVASLLVIQKDPSAIASGNSSAVLDAYQHDPDAFKRDATLMKTFMASSEAANYVRRSGAKLPLLTNEAPFVSPILDPWGKPLCVTGTPTDIVIVSNGGNDKSVRCASAELPSKLLEGVPRNRLIKTDRGYLISIFPRSQP